MRRSGSRTPADKKKSAPVRQSVPPLLQIRQAAFELRSTQPDESVRILRRVLRDPEAKDVWALAHGAISEILLDDFGDVDGAIHHAEALIDLVPGLPVASMALARALARDERNDDADAAFGQALSQQLRLLPTPDGRDSASPEVELGLESLVTSALEWALEWTAWRSSVERDPPALPALDAACRAALTQRWFDDQLDEDEDDTSGSDLASADPDEWVRFTLLWIEWTAQSHPEQTEGIARDVVDTVPLTGRHRHRVLSEGAEAAGSVSRAADEALQSFGTWDDPDLPAALRAIRLLREDGRAIEARQLGDTMLGHVRSEQFPIPDTEVRTGWIEAIQDELRQIDTGLVSLGRGLGTGVPRPPSEGMQ